MNGISNCAALLKKDMRYYFDNQSNLQFLTKVG